MKLDSRIKSKSDILSCFDIEKAKEFVFVDQKGYFANEISSFCDINICKYGTLGSVLGDQQESFYMSETEESFSFFIPDSELLPRKPKEKQYRPYTFMEFTDIFTVGQPIKFRKKGEVGSESYLILNGYSHNQLLGETTTDIYIGRGAYTLDELFSKYEWQEHYTEDFEPFGVEE